MAIKILNAIFLSQDSLLEQKYDGFGFNRRIDTRGLIDSRDRLFLLYRPISLGCRRRHLNEIRNYTLSFHNLYGGSLVGYGI